MCNHLPTIVIDYILAQFFAELPQNAVLVEKFTLIPMLKVFGNSLTHVAGELPVRHVLLNLFNLWMRKKEDERNENHLGLVYFCWRSWMMLQTYIPFHDIVVDWNLNSE